jgi:hypothetical protein
MATPAVIRAEDLGNTMNVIRTWFDAEKIQPVDFRTVVGHAGIGFESFRLEREAERFQRRFASLVLA